MKLGPITIMSTETKDAYSRVVRTASALHEQILSDQTHDYPDLVHADAALAYALSLVPIEDAAVGTSD